MRSGFLKFFEYKPLVLSRDQATIFWGEPLGVLLHSRVNLHLVPLGSLHVSPFRRPHFSLSCLHNSACRKPKNLRKLGTLFHVKLQPGSAAWFGAWVSPGIKLRQRKSKLVSV